MNCLVQFLNDEIQKYDEKNEWESFKLVDEELNKTPPMFLYRFYTKGGKENLTTRRNIIKYFSFNTEFYLC